MPITHTDAALASRYLSGVSEPDAIDYAAYTHTQNSSVDGEDELVNEDARWKGKQQAVFTNWVNMKLKCVDMHVDDLATDFSDGIRLIHLVQVLAKRRVGPYNKQPNFRHQKLENVTMALNFLQNEENLKLVTIDSTHIVDHHIKMIMGLVWTLIVHYSIAAPLADHERQQLGMGKGAGKAQTPREKLLGWVRDKMPQGIPIRVRNFTTDWNDARALGALVDSCAPGLNPDWHQWRPEHKLVNATRAMDLADRWLSVAKLIKPEELVDPKVDELSMMTYLSQYPQAKLVPGAPIRQPHQEQTKEAPLIGNGSSGLPYSDVFATPPATPNTASLPPAGPAAPLQARVYGPGIQQRSGVRALVSTGFTVEVVGLRDVGHRPELDVTVMGTKKGERIPATGRWQADTHSFAVEYTPQSQGEHTVFVNLDGNPVKGSPFVVQVAGQQTKPELVRASGPGLESGVSAGSKTWFEVYTKEAGGGELSVVILSPDGSEPLPVETLRVEEGVYRCEYLPAQRGLHTVNIFLDKRPVANSPFGVRVKPAADPSKVKVWGRGIAAKGVRVNDNTAAFKVDTSHAGDANLRVQVLGPDKQPLRVIEGGKASERAIALYKYTPLASGTHTVLITFGGEHAAKSPYEVLVAPKSSLPVIAYGPGLVSGIANLPADFTLDSRGASGQIDFHIEGPSPTAISSLDKSDGTADVSYTPVACGVYSVSILCAGDHIEGSPFVVEVQPYDGDGARPSAVKVEAITSTPHLYKCTYTPTKTGRHTIVLSWGGVSIPGSPFRVKVIEPIDPSKVKVYGPMVEGSAKSRRRAEVCVDCVEAGNAELSTAISDMRSERFYDFDAVNNGDATHTLYFVPPAPGEYLLHVKYNDAPVPGSPFTCVIQPHVDVSQVYATAKYNAVYLSSTASITVDASSVAPLGGKDKLDAQVRCPQEENDRVIKDVRDCGDGQYEVRFTPVVAGQHSVYLYYEGVPLPCNPLVLQGVQGVDVRRVSAYGKGLQGGVVDVETEFTVDMQYAGVGSLQLDFDGPAKADVNSDDKGDGTCTVRYTAREPGNYVVVIKYGGEEIPGSPFTIPVEYAVSPRSVRAWGPGLDKNGVRVADRKFLENGFEDAAQASAQATFYVDASRSGHSNCEVTVHNAAGAQIADGYAREVGDGRYECTYDPPTKPGETIYVHVKYAGDHVLDSPFSVRLLPMAEPRKVQIDGAILSGTAATAGSVVTFYVDTSNAGHGELTVNATDPERYALPVIVKEVPEIGSGRYECSFLADIPGTYTVDIKFAGEPVMAERRPRAQVNVEKRKGALELAELCSVTERPSTYYVQNESCVVVNTSKLPQSKSHPAPITARVMPDLRPGVLIPVTVVDNKDGSQCVYFAPEEVEPYSVQIRCAGEIIPEGRWQFTPEPAELYSKQIHERVQRVQHTDLRLLPRVEYFKFDLPTGVDKATLEAVIIMPTGGKDRPEVVDNADGTCTMKYQPTVAGLHEMHVKCNGAHVVGSPFTFHVDQIQSDSFVTAYGAGLTYGVAGEPAAFTICAKEAGSGHIFGPGGVSVAIDGPAKADIKCHDNKDGTCSVTWIPPAPGEYGIHVKFAEKDIHGSPYVARVSGENRKRAQLSVGSTCEVSLKIAEEIKGLSASIKSPSGIEEPCFIRRIDKEHLGIGFTPREAGEHLVSVKKRGTLLPHSPFRIKVSREEVGDAAKVRVSGAGIDVASTQQWNDVLVDTRNAGYGGMSISLEGPSRCEIRAAEADEHTHKISYKPFEPGVYVFSLKFADHHVPGSPFTVKAVGDGMGTVTEKLSKPRQQVGPAQVGKPAEFLLRVPNTSPMEMGAQLMDPEGNKTDLEIREISKSTYQVMFTPSRDGVHTISVTYQEQHVAGSPFSFTVGNLKDTGAHRVRAGGPGLIRGQVGENGSFNVYTREAGQGNLTVAVEGPAKAEIAYNELQDGSGYVNWKVPKPGRYAISVKWDDKHIPDSPWYVNVSPDTGEAKKLAVAAFPSMNLQLNRPVTFNVLLNGGVGQLEAKVMSPGGGTEDCFITPIDEGESYAVRFIPREAGNHYVSVMLDGTHMTDSPFRVRVGGRDEADPTAVTASGEGLKQGATGHKLEYVINTCNAGTGNLQVNCDGPSKVTLDAYEVDEGYKVRYTPLAPGDYIMAVKFNGVHIPGSPFKPVISGKSLGGSGIMESSTVKVETVPKSGQAATELPKLKSDAAKVEVKGMGLKRAYPGRANAFSVDTGKAGNDMLTVSVLTSKETPAQEIVIKHQGRGTYMVNFKVAERGKLYVFVQYGGKHVPGSPFVVDCS